MNKVIKYLDSYYLSLDERMRCCIDVSYHYALAFSICVIVGSLTYYFGNIGVELFLVSAVVAVPMIAIRMLALRYLKSHQQDLYIKEVLDQVLYTEDEQDTNNDIDPDEDDDDWFMKIAKGK
ncbi:hypothetical protein [Nonlabens ponticola]|uniref:Uncharacterized protein n=1 Tax=Nonlabens ponticola TaxID=2496866 RepID=A0A3S9MU83_9FLAO|nr:hypothetical protein [Nonlabens ponticola]AZQ42737.1 hypothetical protein EJ995_00210 [Nonlabens ponticola]